MIARFRRWVRRRTQPKPDAVTQHLRAMRAESLAAAKQSNAALRQARAESRDFAETLAVPPAWRREDQEGKP